MFIPTNRLSTLYYATRTGETEEIDSFGNHTGRFSPVYSDPQPFHLLISPKDEETSLEQSGLQQAGMRRMISTEPPPWNVDTVLWIDKEPYSDGSLTPHNYVVERMENSIFATGIIARKVIL